MISLMMGEGDEAMEYMAMTDEDVMIGMSGDLKMADLMAYSGDAPDPAAVPGPHADRRAGARGHARPERAQGRCRRTGCGGRTRCRWRRRSCRSARLCWCRRL